MENTSFDDILISRPIERVVLITLNRPDFRNALRTHALGEIAAVLDRSAADDEIGAVVITGGDKYFAAGADLKEMAALGPIEILNNIRTQHWKRIATFPKPLLAAVEGYALGAGCELAMHADIIIAGETARFGQPEINLGIIPGTGGTQRLTRAVGKSLAMKMVLSGEPIEAAEAKASGLVAEVVAIGDALERALALASIIANRAPLAVRAAKESVLAAFEQGLTTAMESELKSFALLATSRDRDEGIAAFLERRTPQFTGR